MKIYNLCNLFTDDWQPISIWSLDLEKEIYHGTARDIPYEIEEMEICSIDTLFDGTDGCITINVD